MEQAGIVAEAARSVRFYLAELTDEPEAVDAQLLELLRRADNGQDVTRRIADLLHSEPRLEEWTAGFLEYGAPPQVMQPTTKGGYSPLPGVARPIRASRYACPIDGQYVWYRRDLGSVVPLCRDHPQARLVQVD